jgi:hypothetical protein
VPRKGGPYPGDTMKHRTIVDRDASRFIPSVGVYAQDAMQA